MQGSFEKEVQRKMEEMQLTPSAPVWEKIELEIRPEKRKKRGILWFFLACILLAGGGWWFFYASIEDHQQELSLESDKKTTVISPSNTDASKLTIRTNDSNQRTNTNSDSYTEKKGLTNQTMITNHKVPAPTRSDISTTENEVLLSSSQPTKTFTTEDKTPKPSINAGHVPLKEKEATIPALSSVIDGGQKGVEELPVTVTSDSAAKDSIISKKQSQLADSVSKKKVAMSTRWRKQVNLAAGWSSYVEGSDKFLFIPNSNFSSGAGGSVRMPFPVSSGLGFSVGINLFRELNAHWEIGVGLQYAQYATNMLVGSRNNNDTTVRYANSDYTAEAFYNNTPNRNYTNRFHVIEIPVTVSYQPSLNVPLYLSVGAAYGRLLSTNALTYSPTSNIYYNNRENYIRNMLPVFSSLQVELFSKSKVALRVGPTVQYNLVQLQKENTNGKPHLVFAGIKAGVNF